MIFSTRVAGIPCKCRVVSYSTYKPTKITGPCISDAEPPEEGEFDFEILDRRGNPAPWLQAKVTLADEERIAEEFEVELQAEYYSQD